MRICLMIEGQEDVSWDQWLALAEACERGGLNALFRSDHYLSVRGRERLGSLDAWATLAGLAASTSTLRLGTLVSPVTFRHPAVLAKSAVTVDHISGGRVEVGFGAGWNEREHRAYGFPFPEVRRRLSILAEQLEVVHRQWTEDDVTIAGDHYSTDRLTARPRPLQEPHPPIVLGGSGGRRSVELAARWADEYNTLQKTPEECRRLRERLESAWKAHDRDPATVKLSLMTGCIIGSERSELLARAARLVEWRGAQDDPADFLQALSGRWVAGTPQDAVAYLASLAEAGVDRVMLQHLLHDDTDMVDLIGEELVPVLA